jgi:hypothetical protein
VELRFRMASVVLVALLLSSVTYGDIEPIKRIKVAKLIAKSKS